MESKKEFFTADDLYCNCGSHWPAIHSGNCCSVKSAKLANAKVERLVKAYEHVKGGLEYCVSYFPQSANVPSVRLAEADHILNPPGDGTLRGMNAHFEPLE